MQVSRIWGRVCRSSIAAVVALVLVMSSLTFGFANSAIAVSGATNTGIRQSQTFYSYVKAGERLSIDFEKYHAENRGASSFDPVIVVRDPAGTVRYTCAALTLAAADGTTCTRSWTATSDGVWSIDVAKSNSVTSDLGQVEMHWTIAVTAGTTERPGRTWSEDFRAVDRLYNVNPNVDLTLWYQTPQGFTYQVDRLEMQGIDSNFSANAFGNMDTTTCTSAYRTIFSRTSMLGDDTYQQSEGSGCDYTAFKIFFERPDAGLPQHVTLPDGSPTWLMRSEPGVPQVTGIRFDSDGPGSRSGEVMVTTEGFEGNAKLMVDVDGDGVFDGASDREISFSVDGSGQARIAFDGRDSRGVAIATSTPLAFKVTMDRIGEIHFVDADLELLTRGIQVTRLNTPPGGDPDTKLYWDDTWVTSVANDPQAAIKCSTTGSLTGNGVPSAGGVHAWGQGTCGSGVLSINTRPDDTGSGGSWGNNRAVDNWTYVTGEWSAVADYPGFVLSKRANPASETVVEVGDTITYSVTASPVKYAHPEVVSDGLAATTWSGRYSDDISDVRDNATVPLTDLVSSPSAGSSTMVGRDIWTWTGVGIPLATAVTTSYGATVTHVTDGLLHNIAYVHVPVEPPVAPHTCTPGECDQTTHYVPGFTLTKLAVPGSGSTVRAGDTITYQVTGSNTGNTVLDPVTITDDLADVLDNADLVADSFTSSVGAAPTVSSKTLTWTGRLEIGQQVTLGYQVRVKDSVVAGDLVHNVVSSSARPVVPDPSNPDGPGTPGEPITPPEVETEHPVGPAPGFRVSKLSIPASGSVVQPGDTVAYQVTGSNSGNTALNPVTITDNLADVLDDAELVTDSLAASAGNAPTLNGTTLSWTGSLEVGQSVTLSYRVVVKKSVSATSALRNLASGRATPPGGDPITPPEVSTEHPVGVPGFVVSKVSHPVSGSQVSPGDLVSYTVTGSNTGSTVLDPVTITDDLADVLDDAELVAGSLTSSVGDAPTTSGKKLTWSGTLVAGQSVHLTYKVKVKGDAASGARLKNVVVGSATPPGGDPITPPEVSTTHPVADPGFTLTKAADPVSGTQVLAGDTITYTVVGQNTGNTVLDPVTITDDLSDVLDDAELVAGSLASSVGTVPTVSGKTLTWTGTLEVGAEVVLTYRVKVKGSVVAGDLVHNIVSGSATPILPDPDNPEGPGIPGKPIVPPDQETRHPVGVPGFTISKSSAPASGARVVAGQVVTYTVTGSNTGDTVLDPVQLTDDLADVLDNADLVVGSVTSSLGNAVVTGTRLTWTGVLRVAETVTVTYQVKVKDRLAAGARLKNVLHGEATPPGGGTPIVPDEPKTEHPVAVPGFLITKSSDPASGSMVGAGDTITYFVTGANTGSTVLDPVAIIDDLSDVLDNSELVDGSLRASRGEVPVFAGSTLAWKGSLEVGESVVLTYQVRVKVPVTGTELVHNTVTGTATPRTPDPDNPGGPGTPGAPITPPEVETRHPIATPGFTLTKAADPVSETEVGAGDTITYTVTGANTGNTTLAPVTITDDLADVLDNARFVDGSVTTSLGARALRKGASLAWTGTLQPGQVVVITYQVEVNAGQGGQWVHNRVHGEAVPVNPDRPDRPSTPIVPPDVETRHPVHQPKIVNPGGLAFTGADVAMPAGLGLSLLIGGAAALVMARGRRRQSQG